MAIEIPSVTVELDRSRRLVYTYASMKRAKEACGTILPNFTGEDGLLLVVPFLWSCLAPEDRDITVEELAEILPPRMHRALVDPILDLIRASMPDASGNEGAPAELES